MPLVSVIITVFERTDYLAAALRSVVGQRFSDWECIVSDDANTLKARNIFSAFAADQRFRYRCNQSTLGTPLNVAAAVGEAQGKYVTILNDDDLLYPSMLEHLVAVLEGHPEAVLAFGNEDIINGKGDVLLNETFASMRVRGRIGLRPGLIADSIGFAIRRGLMVVMGSVFRRSALDPTCLVSEVGGAYDYWLAIKISEQGKFYFINEKVMAWRSHSDSASARISRAAYAAETYIYKSLLVASRSTGLTSYLNERLAEALFNRGLVFLRNEWEISEARSLFAQSLSVKWSMIGFRYLASSFLPARMRNLSIRTWRAVRSWLR
jgi:glycosyltransferase involved in cell wall biosynthesis